MEYPNNVLNQLNIKYFNLKFSLGYFKIIFKELNCINNKNYCQLTDQLIKNDQLLKATFKIKY